jgi:DNA topoisomerase-2
MEDGQVIEPEYYAPIIPMVLVNGAEGIGTGFSTKIPPYNPLDIIKNIKRIIQGKGMKPINPWWKGFEGTVTRVDDFNYEISGTWSINDNKVTITELPVGEWTSNYKEYLEKMLEDVPVKSKPLKKQPKKDNNFLGYKDSNTESKVHFELTFEDGYLSTVKDLDKLLHLNKKYSVTNMHLYGPEGHIKRYHTVEEIMNDYYNIRLKLYKDRKEYQLAILDYQLKIISFKVKFILMVVKKEIEINNKKKQEIEETLEKNNFPKFGKNKNDSKLTYDYLLSMPIYNLSYEKIEELKKQQQDKEVEYKELEVLTPENIWTNELDILEEEYLKWCKVKNEISNSTGKKKSKKSKK